MRDLDPVLGAAATALLALGLLTVYSASATEFEHQLTFAGFGVGLFLIVAHSDYRRLGKVALGGYGLSLLLLALVHVHGQVQLGARRWLSVGSFPLEPSELAKPAAVAAVAFVLSRRREVGWSDLGLTLALCAPAFALLLLQPDLGTTLVFAAALVGMLFLAGTGWLKLCAVAAMGLVATGVGVRFLHGYQRARLSVFLDPARDPLGAGYNLLQAKIAIGSGGWFGRGFLASGQGRLGFLPERSTDFAFATFAEQFGLVGALLLLGLFVLLVLRLARAAAAAPDRFGYLLASGVAVMVLAQVAENVGMNVGLAPVAGIPLPLISYGGSSLVATLAALGGVESVARCRRPLRAVSQRWRLGPDEAEQQLPAA